MNKGIIIKNGRIIFPNNIEENKTLVIEKGKLIAIIDGEAPDLSEGYKVIDASGKYVSSGFIDIHTHGGGGHDFMDGTVEAYLGAAEMHAKHGTTALLPTTLTSTFEELLKTFDTYRKANVQNNKGAKFLGVRSDELSKDEIIEIKLTLKYKYEMNISNDGIPEYIEEYYSENKNDTSTEPFEGIQEGMTKFVHGTLRSGQEVEFKDRKSVV